MTDARKEFLAGQRPEDVAFYVADDAVDDPSTLDEYGERVADGTLIVVEGEAGRSAFQAATGTDAMGFAKQAMGAEGEIHEDLTGGACPDADGGDADGGDADDSDADGHEARFVFAFAEEQNEDVGGLYGEGDVIHAYAQCACGAAYSHKWVAGER
ncbi:DUF5807 family protein [Natronoarchaeum mannanilyticum]|uniref:DUF5807 family protein n=1 Tax=Natronoarchaeum mannanilyticum TaxID=926360 RepID=A0AAV3T8R5_9EURY